MPWRMREVPVVPCTAEVVAERSFQLQRCGRCCDAVRLKGYPGHMENPGNCGYNMSDSHCWLVLGNFLFPAHRRQEDKTPNSLPTSQAVTLLLEH